MSAPLAVKMRAFAVDHARGAELISAADRLDEAIKAIGGDVRSFMGAYARARRLFAECGGEPLISEASVKVGAALISFLQSNAKGLR